MGKILHAAEAAILAAVLIGVTALASGAEPKVVVVTTKTEAGLVIYDARQSVGKLTWAISGEHSFILDGRVAVCANQHVAALAAMADGGVDLVLLSHGMHTPSPAPSSLTALVSKLAVGLPEAERAKVASAHSTVAAKIASGEIKTIPDALAARKVSIEDSLGTSLPNWSNFFAALEGELKRLRSTGKLSTLAAHGEAFGEIAAGLK